MIKINNTDISDIKINDSSVSKVMVGSSKVWLKGDSGPQDYVQDGLIFQLDGIDKGDNDGYWTDLIGGIQYPLQNAYQVNSNNVHLRNTVLVSNDYPTITNNILIQDQKYYIYTIEFCVDFDINEKNANEIIIGWHNNNTYENCPGSVYFNFTNNAIGTYVSREGNNKLNAYESAYDNFPDTMTGTMVFTSNQIELNKILLTVNKNKLSGTVVTNSLPFSFLPASTSAIGGRQNASWPRALYGKVYAIRVYDKELTEEEILHNQQLDIQRFNLNIPSQS